MTENISFRATEEHRLFLERVAAANGCGICQAARIVLDEAMKSKAMA